MEKKFESEAMIKGNPLYSIACKRINPIYQRENDIRTPFGRDYTRILFSQGYRRLKHKTQVFFSPENDHVCTRNEHVNLVESISYTIASSLGLNCELTKAIAIGHDIGHAPFGHGGEYILRDMSKQLGIDNFFHERNSLHFIDKIETLENDDHERVNLNLCYAIRDGIISHCGEVNQRHIVRRLGAIDLEHYTSPGQYAPFTWEGCVVKMADKIAYLARDIEDALRLHIISDRQVENLRIEINKLANNEVFKSINNGTVVNYFILDVLNESTIEKGISLSKEAFSIMKMLMKFNYQNIYVIERVKIHQKYVNLILHSIYDFLIEYHDKYTGKQLLDMLLQDEKQYPSIINSYTHWLIKYSNLENVERPYVYQNHIVYDFINDELSPSKCIIDYISGMSDAYIIQIFNELLKF